MSKKKIQLVLDDEQRSMLLQLQASTGAESMAHVLRNALGVFAALHSLLLDNGPDARLAIIDRSLGEMQELSIPSLLRPSSEAVTVETAVRLYDAK